MTRLLAKEKKKLWWNKTLGLNLYVIKKKKKTIEKKKEIAYLSTNIQQVCNMIFSGWIISGHQKGSRKARKNKKRKKRNVGKIWRASEAQ